MISDQYNPHLLRFKEVEAEIEAKQKEIAECEKEIDEHTDKIFNCEIWLEGLNEELDDLKEEFSKLDKLAHVNFYDAGREKCQQVLDAINVLTLEISQLVLKHWQSLTAILPAPVEPINTDVNLYTLAWEIQEEIRLAKQALNQGTSLLYLSHLMVDMQPSEAYRLLKGEPYEDD